MIQIKIKNLLFIVLLLGASTAWAQNVGINEDQSVPDASAMLDISSTSKGLLIPRVSTAERTAISSPAIGLVVFDTDLSSFYYYTSADWRVMKTIATGTSSSDVPDSPYTGQLYFDTAGEKLFVYVSTGWAEVSLGTAGASPY